MTKAKYQKMLIGLLAGAALLALGFLIWMIVQYESSTVLEPFFIGFLVLAYQAAARLIVGVAPEATKEGNHFATDKGYFALRNADLTFFRLFQSEKAKKMLIPDKDEANVAQHTCTAEILHGVNLVLTVLALLFALFADGRGKALLVITILVMVALVYESVLLFANRYARFEALGTLPSAEEQQAQKAAKAKARQEKKQKAAEEKAKADALKKEAKEKIAAEKAEAERKKAEKAAAEAVALAEAKAAKEAAAAVKEATRKEALAKKAAEKEAALAAKEEAKKADLARKQAAKEEALAKKQAAIEAKQKEKEAAKAAAEQKAAEQAAAKKAAAEKKAAEKAAARKESLRGMGLSATAAAIIVEEEKASQEKPAREPQKAKSKKKEKLLATRSNEDLSFSGLAASLGWEESPDDFEATASQKDDFYTAVDSSGLGFMPKKSIYTRYYEEEGENL